MDYLRTFVHSSADGFVAIVKNLNGELTVACVEAAPLLLHKNGIIGTSSSSSSSDYSSFSTLKTEYSIAA